MVGQPVDVLSQPVGIEPLDGLDDLAWRARRRSSSRLP